MSEGIGENCSVASCQHSRPAHPHPHPTQEELRNAERGQGRPLVLTTKDRAGALAVGGGAAAVRRRRVGGPAAVAGRGRAEMRREAGAWDALLSLAAANIAGTGPHIAGLIMAAGATTSAHQKIYPATDRILSRASEHMMPVLEVQQGLFETARLTATVNPGILPDSTRKIEHAKQLFNQFIDADVIISSLNIPKAPKLTPKAFIHSIHEICRSQPQNIVLPEAPSPQKDKYADMLVEIRKAKGLTREGALDLLGDMNMFATMMVRAGDADGMVSGASCTTANTIRPALQAREAPRKGKHARRTVHGGGARAARPRRRPASPPSARPSLPRRRRTDRTGVPL
eukprot:scaffold22.g6077.t1